MVGIIYLVFNYRLYKKYRIHVWSLLDFKAEQNHMIFET